MRIWVIRAVLFGAVFVVLTGLSGAWTPTPRTPAADAMPAVDPPP